MPPGWDMALNLAGGLPWDWKDLFCPCEMPLEVGQVAEAKIPLAEIFCRASRNRSQEIVSNVF